MGDFFIEQKIFFFLQKKFSLLHIARFLLHIFCCPEDSLEGVGKAVLSPFLQAGRREEKFFCVM
ncbi:MAG: hypothetical protein J6Y84_08680 [Bacteroidaceae bacterium]|nr:hypothetical protein [Bacteroidaceae bacterium]